MNPEEVRQLYTSSFSPDGFQKLSELLPTLEWHELFRLFGIALDMLRHCHPACERGNHVPDCQAYIVYSAVRAEDVRRYPEMYVLNGVFS